MEVAGVSAGEESTPAGRKTHSNPLPSRSRAARCPPCAGRLHRYETIGLGESRFCSSGSARGERSKRSGDGEAVSRPPVSGPGEIWKRPALGGPACYCGPVWRG
jgi:hypothetical protein